jgi:hypothetical protein
LLAAAVVVTLGVALVSCGGGSSETAKPSPSASPVVAKGLLPFETSHPLVTPTPQPEPMIILLSRVVDFNALQGDVTWDGPDDRVQSIAQFHCGAASELKQRFKLPDELLVHYDNGTFAYFNPTVVLSEPSWVWTGYYKSDWQVWRGNDARVLYLVKKSKPDVAFAYFASGCA